jgi:uncharacterized protein
LDPPGSQPTEHLVGEAEVLLASAQVGFLGMSGHRGPYVLPVSFAHRGDQFFMHGGPGQKADLLAADARVCLAVTSSVGLTKGADACGDNFSYSSALIFGQARLLEDDEERVEALRVIAEKYHPEAADVPFRPDVLARTLVYAVKVTDASFKSN